MGPRNVGVEEELLLVDPDDGRALAVASGTSLDELGSELRRWRRAAAQAAQANGAQVAALATSPLPVAPSITPDPRYREMIDKFGLTAEQQLACGCHIHVEVGSDEEGVAVLDRIRGWLPALLALSGNSPFWQGEDTGRPAPAQCVARALIEHVTPALEDLGECDAVQDLTDAVFGRGNGSTLQREVCRRGGSLADVVASAVTRTTGA